MNDPSDWKRLGYMRQPRQALALLLSRATERLRLRLALQARGLPIPPELAKRPAGRSRKRAAENRDAGPVLHIGPSLAVRRRRFMGRHHHSRPKPTHTPGGVPLYDERRLSRLLLATDHVAPRLPAQRLEQSNRLRDARAVVKMYVSGAGVMSLGGDLLRRLATDGYGKGLRPLGRAAVGTASSRTGRSRTHEM